MEISQGTTELTCVARDEVPAARATWESGDNERERWKSDWKSDWQSNTWESTWSGWGPTWGTWSWQPQGFPSVEVLTSVGDNVKVSPKTVTATSGSVAGPVVDVGGAADELLHVHKEAHRDEAGTEESDTVWQTTRGISIDVEFPTYTREDLLAVRCTVGTGDFEVGLSLVSIPWAWSGDAEKPEDRQIDPCAARRGRSALPEMRQHARPVSLPRRASPARHLPQRVASPARSLPPMVCLWVGPLPLPNNEEVDRRELLNLLEGFWVHNFVMRRQCAYVTVPVSQAWNVRVCVTNRRIRDGPQLSARQRVDAADFARDQLSPLDIIFSQPDIEDRLEDGQTLEEAVASTKAEGLAGGWSLLTPPFPPVRVVPDGHCFRALDNRRLYVLQRRAVELWPSPCVAPVLTCVGQPPSRFWAKLANRSPGDRVAVLAPNRTFMSSMTKWRRTWSCEEAIAEAELAMVLDRDRLWERLPTDRRVLEPRDKARQAGRSRERAREASHWSFGAPDDMRRSVARGSIGAWQSEVPERLGVARAAFDGASRSDYSRDGVQWRAVEKSGVPRDQSHCDPRDTRSRTSRVTAGPCLGEDAFPGRVETRDMQRFLTEGDEGRSVPGEGRDDCARSGPVKEDHGIGDETPGKGQTKLQQTPGDGSASADRAQDVPVKVSVLEDVSEQNERRVDPDTGQERTFEEFCKTYGDEFSEDEIREYWDDVR